MTEDIVGIMCLHIYSTLSQKIQENLSDVSVNVSDLTERVVDVQLKVNGEAENVEL